MGEKVKTRPPGGYQAENSEAAQQRWRLSQRPCQNSAIGVLPERSCPSCGGNRFHVVNFYLNEEPFLTALGCSRKTCDWIGDVRGLVKKNTWDAAG